MDAVIEARGLTKRFKDQTVVRGIDFRVPAGQCFGFLGPNGAGKTTTLRMILGQSPISAGSLQVFGLPVPRRGSDVRMRVGVVPQTDNLDPDFTVVENLRVYGSYFNFPKTALEPRIEELLRFVELSDRAHKRITTLSGGMQRRLTIARALINDPELIVLDEPTTGLDPQARHMIWARLRDLRQSGKTLLLTTHYMEEAERLCDDLVIMDHGNILDQGSPRALVRRHVEPEVVEIREAANSADELLNSLADCRAETIGDTVYCYTHDARPLVAQIDGIDSLVFLHRPANLEDVFLKITGRELKD
ncbi:MAG: ATP-binding cassette domain-containing protein [Acidiferrobacterales bacterium]